MQIPAVIPCSLPALMRILRHDAIAEADRDRGNQKYEMNSGLRHDGLFIIRVSINEGLEQVNGRNADYGGGKLDLQHGRIDMRQPFRLIMMPFKIHS